MPRGITLPLSWGTRAMAAWEATTAKMVHRGTSIWMLTVRCLPYSTNRENVSTFLRATPFPVPFSLRRCDKIESFDSAV